MYQGVIHMMRKKYESCKKIFVRCAGLGIMIVMTGLFYGVWDGKLNQLMDRKFLGKGNLLMVFSYVVFVYVFLELWGGFKVGYEKMLNVVLSQLMADISVNLLMYIQVTLMIGTVDHLGLTARLMAVLGFVQGICCLLLTFVSVTVYARLFPAYKVLQINGDYVNYLRLKIKDRDDKYQICEEISVHNSWDVLTQKMDRYDAVLLNDVPTADKNKVLKYCFDHSIRVYFTPKLSDIIVKGTQVITLFDSPLLLCRNMGLNFEQRLLKRLMDIVISLAALLVLSPVFLVTACCIKYEDKGPVLFKQERCTLNEKSFYIYKFRSMIVDAEQDGKSRPASESDGRITKVGRVIRRLRIDELPQLVNILKGEMSLVGPRPERIEHMKKYTRDIPEFTYRLKMKGGLTGYAQVYGRYNTTAYDKLKMDMLYVVNYSLLLDIRIIFETFKILLKKESTAGFTRQQIYEIRASGAEKRTGDETYMDLEP